MVLLTCSTSFNNSLTFVSVSSGKNHYKKYGILVLFSLAYSITSWDCTRLVFLPVYNLGGVWHLCKLCFTNPFYIQHWNLICILLSFLWLEINPCLILVPTMYHTWLYDKRFGRYDVFCINHPNHPWGTLDFLGVPPLTSTPLPPGRPKLNQRRPQIRGHFWPSSSRLGATAPAPLRSLFGAQGSCFQDALLSPSLLTLYRGQHCSLLSIEVFICLGHWSWSFVTWLSHDQLSWLPP